MNLVPWILADDLSGALEAGAAWRAQGWRVTLPLSGGPSRAALLTGSDVRLFSTESRNLSPDAAYAVARDALRLCARSCGSLRYKKIDSTLRGPIAAELLALMETQEPPLVVITPANPAMGRTVVDGELRVDGNPIALTAFARDPVWPVLHGDVSRLLREGKVESVREVRASSRIGIGGLMEAIETAMGEGVRVIAADAERASDLPALVIAVRTFAPRAIFVGSGALGPILAERCEMPAPAPRSQREGGVLYVLGSKHKITRLQLAKLASRRRLSVVYVSPTSDAATGEGAAGLVSGEGAVVLAVKEDLKASPLEVNLALGEAVRQVVAATPIRSIFATGGETARTVCDILEATELEIADQIEPGVVRSIVQTPRGAVTLVVKPGGFGTEETLVAIAQALGAP